MTRFDAFSTWISRVGPSIGDRREEEKKVGVARGNSKSSLVSCICMALHACVCRVIALFPTVYNAGNNTVVPRNCFVFLRTTRSGRCGQASSLARALLHGLFSHLQKTWPFICRNK